MDALHFGRWLSQRRRQIGFSSQRALAASVCHDPLTSTFGISEDFLARLEAGKFVHPFRSIVRKRVLALAWFLCKTPRDVKTYLRASEITGLDANETQQLHLLHQHLAAQHHQQYLPLPPRPQHLIGREATTQNMLNTISSMGTGLYAITGMAGVGKSALAFDVLHRLSSNQCERLLSFPDGIAAFTCTGYRGIEGLVALLNDIIAAFSLPASSRRGFDLTQEILPHTLQQYADSDLARAINRTRLVLAGKRTLLLLDDLDAALPLRLLLEALLPQQQHTLSHHAQLASAAKAGVVLTTSRCIPPPALITHHLHLQPLEPAVALTCLTALLPRPLQPEEEYPATQICAAIGYLPLAIEAVATAITVKGFPLSLLAAHISAHPLDDLLDGERELRSRLAQMLTPFDTQMQKRFALLSALGVQSFGLTSAAVLGLPTPGSGAFATQHPPYVQSGQEHNVQLPQNDTSHEPESSIPISLSDEHLARTASDLGQFVRHSLIELTSPPVAITSAQEKSISSDRTVRYQLHPLIHALAQHTARQLAKQDIEAITSQPRSDVVLVANPYAAWQQTPERIAERKALAP